MAFATSNVALGSNGDAWALRGTWSGNSEDASGTVTVRGIVYSALFQNQDATSQEDRPTPVDVSYSGTTGLSTITVHNHATVTTGRFNIVFK
jgi:hypothetical protein